MRAKLVRKDDGTEVKVGDEVTDHRGAKYTLKAMYPFDGMLGKVAVNDRPGLLNATVIGCEFVRVD